MNPPSLSKLDCAKIINPTFHSWHPQLKNEPNTRLIVTIDNTQLQSAPTVVIQSKAFRYILDHHGPEFEAVFGLKKQEVFPFIISQIRRNQRCWDHYDLGN